jgi:hypothetical protein
VPLRQPTAACLAPAPNIATNTPPKALMRQCGGLFDSLVRPEAQTALYQAMALHNLSQRIYQKMKSEEKSGFGDRFERSLSELERAQPLKKISTALMIACHCINATSAALLVIGGMKFIVILLSLASLTAYISSTLINKRVKSVYSKATAIKREIDLVERIKTIEKNGSDPSGKIPLTVGFMNIAGKQFDVMLLDDAAAMSKIFRQISLGRTEAPKSDVLFIYGIIDQKGEFSNSKGENVRLLAQKSGASIAIVATPNSAEHIKIATSTEGPKLANIIFTVDRKDEAFRNFFMTLFQKMRAGGEMLNCWVELAPQGPQSKSQDAPVTLLVAEAGKIAFQS